MRAMLVIGRLGICVLLAGAIPTTVFAQPDVSGGPLTGPSVRGASFSAEATTIVRQTLRDGTRVERVGSARYYRDQTGRVRVEHMTTGLDPLNSAVKGQVRTIIDTDPDKGGLYTLDPLARTANLGVRDVIGMGVGGGDTYALPLGGSRWASLAFHRGERRWRGRDAIVKEESLGTARISGVDTIGRRITITVPAGASDNDQPFQIVNERWESPELKLLIYAVSSDPRTGDIEYRLTNISRAEPSADLFAIPSGYLIATTGDNGWTGLVYAERGDQAAKRW